ncbi:MAG: hypothetical protein KIT09_07795 [Bryobacteraceae bacterium]|nr:hypothetical protein [Bryobacteraceae bacterium]
MGTATNAPGFVYHNGEFREITCPSGKLNRLVSINNKSVVLGHCDDRSGRSFLFEDGRAERIDLYSPVPDKDVLPTAINDKGEIVGAYFDQGRHGFLLTGRPVEPRFVTLDPVPTALVKGINSKGDIVGFGGRSFLGVRSSDLNQRVLSR